MVREGHQEREGVHRVLYRPARRRGAVHPGAGRPFLHRPVPGRRPRSALGGAGPESAERRNRGRPGPTGARRGAGRVTVAANLRPRPVPDRHRAPDPRPGNRPAAAPNGRRSLVPADHLPRGRRGDDRHRTDPAGHRPDRASPTASNWPSSRPTESSTLSANCPAATCPPRSPGGFTGRMSKVEVLDGRATVEQISYTTIPPADPRPAGAAGAVTVHRCGPCGSGDRVARGRKHRPDRQRGVMR